DGAALGGRHRPGTPRPERAYGAGHRRGLQPRRPAPRLGQRGPDCAAVGGGPPPREDAPAARRDGIPALTRPLLLPPRRPSAPAESGLTHRPAARFGLLDYAPKPSSPARSGPTHRLPRLAYLDGCHPRPVNAHYRCVTGLASDVLSWWDIAVASRRISTVPP